MSRNLAFAKLCFAALAAAAILAAGHAARADVVSFRGEVQRGDTVVHRFAHKDVTFEFRLASISYGWLIWISDPARPERNYVTLSTPPFRGLNPARIEGWHFRNADNTGPNEPGSGNVNAPQKKRRFEFIPDAANRRAAAEALDILLWPDGIDETEIKAAEERFLQIPKAEGLLRIEALEFGNLAAGERAWIERMAFSVTIDLPD